MGDMLETSLQIALNQLSQNQVLKNYNILLRAYDDECQEENAVRIAGSILRNSYAGTNSIVPIIIGPICYGINWVGLMVENTNFLSIADLNPSTFPFKSVFQFRPYIGVFQAIPSFLQALGWKKVYFLSETYTLWEQIEQAVTKDLNAYNISVGGSSQVVTISRAQAPDYHFFIEAAMELKKRDARVIIAFTRFTIFLACALYDVGLYGKKVVLLWEGVMMFQSNDPMKPPGCTEHKLASVLRSIIYISQATPMNLDPDHEDVLGMTPQRFDSMMKTTLQDEKAEIRKTWFQWRATFYSQLVGVSLILNKTEENLQQMGSNLTEWLTDSENFRRNSSFLRNMMATEFHQFKYKGLNTYGDKVITQPVLKAGFHQVQQENSKLDSAESFQTVPVAFFDGDTGELEMMEEFQWRTQDNRIPVDSITVYERNTALLPNETKYSIFTISILILIASMANAGALLFGKIQTDIEYVLQTRQFNFGIAVGNIFTSLFLIIMSMAFVPTPVICSISAVILIFALWFGNICLMAKLELSRAIDSQVVRISQKRGGKNRKRRARKGQVSGISKTIIERRKKVWKVVVIALPAIFTITAIIWLFGIDPMSSKTIAIRSETIEDDRYDDFSQTCMPNPRSFTIFLGVFGLPYFLLLIRFIQCGFNTKTIKQEAIPEIISLRIAAYATPSISMFGVLTIILLFSSHAVKILSASLVLVLSMAVINVIFQTISTILSFRGN